MHNTTQPNQGKITALRNQGTLNPFPQKVRDPLFKNEAFFDPRDIIQVKYELLRRVQIEGSSITDAVKSFGFSRLSFYRILAVFEKFGLYGLIPQKRGPRQAHKMTAEVLKLVNEKIKEDPSISSLQLKKTIEEKFGVSVHARSIDRALSKSKKKRKTL